MEEITKNVEEKKLSYEELENLANTLYLRLQEADMSNMFKRLDYLFKVVENKPVFSAKFAKACVDEIEDLLTIKTIKE